MIKPEWHWMYFNDEWNGKRKKPILKQVVLTQQEIWDAMKPNVHKSKKTYTRKQKHPHKN